MGTTVWIDDKTREDLRNLQEKLGTSSANATIRRLIDKPTLDARTLFARHHDAIAAILKRHGLRRLIAFGSRARGDATPASDFDLAAEVAHRGNPLAILAAEGDLEELFGIRVDIVELPNDKLRAVLEHEGVPFAA